MNDWTRLHSAWNRASSFVREAVPPKLDIDSLSQTNCWCSVRDLTSFNPAVECNGWTTPRMARSGISPCEKRKPSPQKFHTRLVHDNQTTRAINTVPDDSMSTNEAIRSIKLCLVTIYHPEIRHIRQKRCHDLSGNGYNDQADLRVVFQVREELLTSGKAGR